MHPPQQVFDGAAILRAAGDLDHAAPVRVTAQLVGQRPGGGRFADAAGQLAPPPISLAPAASWRRVGSYPRPLTVLEYVG